MAKNVARSVKPTKESLALKAAIEASNLTHAIIAEHMGCVSPSLVSQWVTGRTPVPAKSARKLARLVGCSPEIISFDFAEVMAHEPESAENQESAVAVEIDALRYVVSAIASVTAAHRPIEAREMAEVLRRSVPLQARTGGFLQILLATLEKPRA